jgi:hypothetical protein
MHSYEVAAFIMPFPQGRRPTEGEISAFANRIFAPAEGGG